jgi:hypothetical protein
MTFYDFYDKWEAWELPNGLFQNFGNTRNGFKNTKLTNKIQCYMILSRFAIFNDSGLPDRIHFRG